MPRKKNPELDIVSVMETLESVGIYATVPQVRALIEAVPTICQRRKPWKIWDEGEYEKLIEMYTAGSSRAEIQKELGRTSGQINGAITRLKLTRS